MPANVTLFNQSCEKVYEFGSGHRNTVCFNIHGSNILLSLRVYVWHNVFRGLDSRTHGLSWKLILNNNPGIIHLLQH